MAVEGSLDLFQLPEILQIISQEQKTGILTVQGQDDIVAISFLDGQVVAADALNKTLEDNLGEVLLQRDLVTRRDYEEALAEKRSGGGRMMDVLVETGALGRGELLEALRTLTFDLLAELLRWREGEFKFYSGDEVSYEEGFRPIAVEDLLLATLEDQAKRGEEKKEAPKKDKAAAGKRAAETKKALEKEAPPAGLATPAEGKKESRRPAAAGQAKTAEAASSSLAPTLDEAPLRPLEPERAAPTPRREPSPRRLRRRSARSRQWLSWTLALLAVLLLVAVLAAAPSTLILPSPANDGQLTAFHQSRWEVRYAKIEAALRSYFLLELHLPEQLEDLVQIGMLAPEEIRGPLGQTLLYEADELIYQLRPLLTEEQTAFVGSVREDFLLDPDLLKGVEEGSTQPLVLLD